MSIYITGDLHREHDFTKLRVLNEKSPHLTKSDYVIICGDFGGVWVGDYRDKPFLQMLDKLNYTILFVDGNHENHPAISKYPQEEWNEGQIHRISNSIIHLMRGQVYEIEGLKFFTMGGASSHDKEWRTEGISWWPEELPSDEEYNTAFENLDKHNWEVNYVVSHCAPDSVQEALNCRYGHDKLTNFLEVVKQRLKHDAWFFGHYHVNDVIDETYFPLYNHVLNLD